MPARGAGIMLAKMKAKVYIQYTLHPVNGADILHVFQGNPADISTAIASAMRKDPQIAEIIRAALSTYTTSNHINITEP